MEDLIRRKNEAYEKVKASFKKLEKARALMHQYEERYWREKDEFERLDRELAMKDGRYQKLAEEGKRKQADAGQLIVNLNKSQILAIAEALGVEVEMEGE
jgi:hypothetical protein